MIERGDRHAVTELDIDALFKRGVSNCQVLAQAFESWSNLELAMGLAQYIHFNSVFAAGVAGLSAEVAKRQNCFRDKQESIEIIADRSVDVAARIFSAAIEEFGYRHSHRAMAQETMRQTLTYFGYSGRDISVLSRTTLALQQVAAGYAVNNDAGVFRAMGFHMGSELLADQEFNVIEEVLNNCQPLLVQHLKRKRAYAWIQVHTTVQTDHFATAVEGANLALELNSAPGISTAQAKEFMLGGMRQFAAVQLQFLQSLVSIKNWTADIAQRSLFGAESQSQCYH